MTDVSTHNPDLNNLRTLDEIESYYLDFQKQNTGEEGGRQEAETAFILRILQIIVEDIRGHARMHPEKALLMKLDQFTLPITVTGIFELLDLSPNTPYSKVAAKLSLLKGDNMLLRLACIAAEFYSLHKQHKNAGALAKWIQRSSPRVREFYLRNKIPLIAVILILVASGSLTALFIYKKYHVIKPVTLEDLAKTRSGDVEILKSKFGNIQRDRLQDYMTFVDGMGNPVDLLVCFFEKPEKHAIDSSATTKKGIKPITYNEEFSGVYAIELLAGSGHQTALYTPYAEGKKLWLPEDIWENVYHASTGEIEINMFRKGIAVLSLNDRRQDAFEFDPEKAEFISLRIKTNKPFVDCSIPEDDGCNELDIGFNPGLNWLMFDDSEWYPLN